MNDTRILNDPGIRLMSRGERAEAFLAPMGETLCCDPAGRGKLKPPGRLLKGLPPVSGLGGQRRNLRVMC
jgi:hypothetical protein